MGYQWRNIIRRAAGLTLALVFFLSAAVFAAAAPSITAVRFGKSTEHDRIVFDVSAVPKYTTRTEKDGTRIVLEMMGIGDT